MTAAEPVVPARPIAQLQAFFEGDPPYAARAADLIESIMRLQHQLKALDARQGTTHRAAGSLPLRSRQLGATSIQAASWR